MMWWTSIPLTVSASAIQGTMTSPGHRFRTHDRSWQTGCQPPERVEIGLKLERLHVIGVPAKTTVAPAEVHGIRARPPETSQARHVDVADPGAREIVGQPITIELRIVARARNSANVDEAPDTLGGEQADQVVDAPRTVAHRPDAHPSGMPPGPRVSPSATGSGADTNELAGFSCR